jgi:hypothetical protein
MSLLQLNPPIPLNTPHGPAMAHVLIDHGPEHNLLWVCFNDKDGECWTWPNNLVRAQKNITFGRKHISEIRE